MYFCFEDDDKRSAFPEASLICMDENGFTVKSFTGARSGSPYAFFKMQSYQGCVQNFNQALGWIKRTPARAKEQQEKLPANPTF